MRERERERGEAAKESRKKEKGRRSGGFDRERIGSANKLDNSGTQRSLHLDSFHETEDFRKGVGARRRGRNQVAAELGSGSAEGRPSELTSRSVSSDSWSKFVSRHDREKKKGMSPINFSHFPKTYAIVIIDFEEKKLRRERTKKNRLIRIDEKKHGNTFFGRKMREFSR